MIILIKKNHDRDNFNDYNNDENHDNEDKEHLASCMMAADDNLNQEEP